MASSVGDNESEWAAGTAADIQEAACRSQAKSPNVAAQLVGAHPGVLPNIFAIRLAPKLPHQRRVEITVKRLVAVCA